MTALVDRHTGPLAASGPHLPQLRVPPTRWVPQHACFECFGPLEIGYDPIALARVYARRNRRRPALTLALRRTAARRAEPRDSRRVVHRHDAADSRRPAGRRTRLHRAGVDQGRLRQSNALLQGPRRVGGHHGGTRARVRAHCLCLDRQPGELGGRPRSTGGHAVDRFIPSDLEPPKIVQTAVYGTTLVGIEGPTTT